MSFKNTDIGLIPSEWDFDTIGDSLYIKGRIGWKGLKKSEYIDRSDYRIINGSNVVNNNIDWSGCGYISEERYEESPEIMLKPNDIVMTKDGTIGKLAIIRSLEQKTTVASGLFVIRVEDNSIDVDYLYYYFSSFYFKELVKSRIEGSVIPHLYQKDLVALKLPLPDLSEQKAISKILRTLDDKIEVNNQINRTLENMAQAIFKQWFVDFEFPNEDGEPYRSSGGEMIASELGMIPKGWEVGKFIDLIEITSGKRPGKRSDLAMEDCKYPLVGASSIMGYTDDFNFEEKILVIGRVGTHGVVQRFNNKGWASDNTLVIKSDNYEFAYQILNQIDYKAINRGSTQPLITQTDIKNYTLIIPTEGYLNKFELLVGSLFEIYSNHCIENSKLTEIRDSLLPKLMSGEIRVPLDEEGDVS